MKSTRTRYQRFLLPIFQLLMKLLGAIWAENKESAQSFLSEHAVNHAHDIFVCKVYVCGQLENNLPKIALCDWQGLQYTIFETPVSLLRW